MENGCKMETQSWTHKKLFHQLTFNFKLQLKEHIIQSITAFRCIPEDGSKRIGYLYLSFEGNFKL